MQPRSPSNVRIIDVSNVNGVIDWQQVKRSGIVGVYDKITEGATYHDARFAANYEGAKSVGLLRGTYCFARPRTSSALDEVNSFVASVNAHGGFAELPPMLDVEDNGGLNPAQLTKWIRDWFDRVHALTGIQPILYTYTAFAQKYLRGLTDLPIWIADYRGYAAPPDVSGWNRWTMYQFTNVGHVPGIKGNCDISEFAGSYQDLLLFCKQRGVDLNMLKPGDSNHEAVKEMQKELLDVLHLDPKKFAVDGLYGPMTTAAVKSFQFQFKVGSQPGIADDTTLSVLKQKYDAVHPAPTPAPVPQPQPAPVVNVPQSVADAEKTLLAAIDAEKASAQAQVAQAQQQVADAQKKVQVLHDGVAQAENILKGVLD